MRTKTCLTLFNRLNRFFLKGYVCLPQPTFNVASRQFSNAYCVWHTVGALCLERKPVVTQELTPLEQRYFQYLQKLEIEKSYLSDHEKRHLEDLRIAEKLKKGEVEDMDTVSKQTAQDFEDACIEEFNKYKPNPRITEADKTNDRKSLHRKLDSSLVLVVKQKLGNDYRWILPQTIHQEGDTLRQTAERSLHELCPDPIQVRFMGNAPVGYYKYKYPKAARKDGVIGAKVFFFKAQLLEKNPKYLNFNITDTNNDILWLTHSELNEVLQTDYGKTVQTFLLPDTFDVEEEDNNSSTNNNSFEDDEPIAKTSASN
ncbi:39S ribosomal protein L46, mitochondrial-like [Argiope bruennichi]|uniref:39S ribosomal protein L46, mitochondrial-like n=1 Tax=Argiope bruennichi TaxID=94029 RepID=UPI0024942D36|nr:39S ribosomal protein L46, mitochondrial-like [Argiope bruennichi]